MLAVKKLERAIERSRRECVPRDRRPLRVIVHAAAVPDRHDRRVRGQPFGGERSSVHEMPLQLSEIECSTLVPDKNPDRTEPCHYG